MRHSLLSLLVGVAALGCDRPAPTPPPAVADPQLSAQEQEARAQMAQLATQVKGQLAAAPLTVAQEAYVNGQYENAKTIAKQAVASEPLKAWRIIGASDCFLKDRPAASEALSHLDDAGQKFLRYVCQRNGVSL